MAQESLREFILYKSSPSTCEHGIKAISIENKIITSTWSQVYLGHKFNGHKTGSVEQFVYVCISKALISIVTQIQMFIK